MRQFIFSILQFNKFVLLYINERSEVIEDSQGIGSMTDPKVLRNDGVIS